MRTQTRQMPQDVVQALLLMLDWALLASYRVAFEILEQRHRLAEGVARLERAAQQGGDQSLLLSMPIPRPVALATVIAPQTLMRLDWIIDYETANHQTLFAMGKADAARVLAQR